MANLPTAIDFEVPNEFEGEVFDGGVDIESPEEDLGKLKNADDIVAPSNFGVAFTYPLTKPAVVAFSPGKPTTRREFAQIICDYYSHIYEEEEKQAGPEIVNRVGFKTRGPYGIWGHGIGDLSLIRATRDKDGLYRLSVDS